MWIRRGGRRGKQGGGKREKLNEGANEWGLKPSRNVVLSKINLKK